MEKIRREILIIKYLWQNKENKYEKEIEHDKEKCDIIWEENKKLKEENNNYILIINNLQKELKELNEIKLIYNQKYKNNSIEKYNTPTLVGLNNIGATCFMNSTLQCLSQTKQLSNYFLNENNKDKIINNNISLINMNENQLSPVYLELILKLWIKDEGKSFEPYNFMNKINEMNPLFQKGQPGDSKDFIIFPDYYRYKSFLFYK